MKKRNNYERPNKKDSRLKKRKKKPSWPRIEPMMNKGVPSINEERRRSVKEGKKLRWKACLQMNEWNMRGKDSKPNTKPWRPRGEDKRKNIAKEKLKGARENFKNRWTGSTEKN